MTSPDTSRLSVPLERLSIAEVIAALEPLSGLPATDQAGLAAAATRVRRPAGATVLAEGQVPDALYVVLRGRVNLVHGSLSERDLILVSLGAGEVFGESCAFDERPGSTAAVAAVPTDLLRIPAEALTPAVRRDPEALLRLMRLLHQRLQEFEAVASGLALCDVEQRLRQTLARLVRRQGRRAPSEPGWVLAPVPTQSELARMVGSCRETVSRTLSAMARSGLVSTRGRRLVLDDRILAEAAA
jgi:CRP-like cAMP-binding protein